MAGGGIKLGTGYIEIVADTTQLSKQIKDALNQAGNTSVKSAGQQMGKDLSQGVHEGLNKAPTPSSPSIITDVLHGKASLGTHVKEQGKKIGATIAAGISEGIKQGGASTKIDEAVTSSAKPKDIGAKLGKDIAAGLETGIDIKAAGKKISDTLHSGVDAKAAGKKIGKELSTGIGDETKKIAADIKSGDMKGAFDEVGKSVKTVTDRIADVGKNLGVDLGGVKKWGDDTATTLDNLGTRAQNISTGVKTVMTDLGKLGTGDAATRLGTLSTVLTDLDNLTGKKFNLGPAAESLKGFADGLAGIKGVKDDLAGIVSSLGAIPGLAPKAKDALGTIVPAPGGKPGEVVPAPGGQPGGGNKWIPPIGQTLGAAALGYVAGQVNPAQNPNVPMPGQGPQTVQQWIMAGKGAERDRRLEWAMRHVPKQGDEGAWNRNFQPPWAGDQGPQGPANQPPPPPQPVYVPGMPIPGQAPQPTGAPPQSGPFPAFNIPEARLGHFAATTSIAEASINISNATINAGSVTVYGGNSGGQTSFPARGSAKSWYAEGGAIPIMAHAGEHVLTADDVNKMGGQQAVYGFRASLQSGGEVDPRYTPHGTGRDPDTQTSAGLAAGMEWARTHPNDPFGAMLNDPGFQPPLTAPEPPLQLFDEGGAIGNINPETLKNLKDVGKQALVDEPKPAAGAEQQPDSTREGKANDVIDTMRTAGFLPSGGQSTAVSGTSFLAGIFNLGNQAVAGIIDTGASAAEMAVSLAATAGTLGAGAAAGPAASIGIQMGAAEAKRAVSYGFQLASIWSDALLEITHPFGLSRWLGYDYTQFLPNIDFSKIGTTTAEKAVQSAMGKGGKGGEPGDPVAPEHLAGSQPPGQPVPKFGEKGTPMSVNLSGVGDTGPAAGPGTDLRAVARQAMPQTPQPAAAPPPGPAPSPPGAIDQLMNIIPFDTGGWWPTDTMGVNTTGRPELVLSPSQISAAQPATTNRSGGGDVIIHNLTAVDADDVGKQIARQQRLQMMRYSSRPGPS